MKDLFETKQNKASEIQEYDASSIEVLEGLEPVRKRPGMYIGGTDNVSLHHLATEVFDNSMDEVVAKFAKKIKLVIKKDNIIEIADDGRGIPIDKHPKYPDKSALEVIFTTLHSGGKFSGKAYHTAGGLHGVGISVVNALSEFTKVEVTRGGNKYSMEFARGIKQSELIKEEHKNNKSGTKIIFKPDSEIFGQDNIFNPKRLLSLAKSKAYLFKGVKVDIEIDPEIALEHNIESNYNICYPNGLLDYIDLNSSGKNKLLDQYFYGSHDLIKDKGRIEWCVAFYANYSKIESYCNTISTPLGGTHLNGFKNGMIKAVKEYSQKVNYKNYEQIIIDDILVSSQIVLSSYLREPEFQGQTKEKLVNRNIAKNIEDIIKDHFEQFLLKNKDAAKTLLDSFLVKAQNRIKISDIEKVSRKTLVSKLRLPGKLTDCSKNDKANSEIFLVEGDSAGGSAKQARNRETQAILPLKGKILNVANSSFDKINKNQEISDLLIALGCNMGDAYDEEKLRYEKIIIMTDADVDGSHIASLLMTFFFKKMPDLIKNGHLYLAYPPLYRISNGKESYYANDEKEREAIIAKLSKNSKNKIDLGRFKGLGEMTPKQLKETTMDPQKRRLFKISLAEDVFEDSANKVESLMGKKPELRLKFIQENAFQFSSN